MPDISTTDDMITALGIYVNFGTVAAPDWKYVCSMDARSHQTTSEEETASIIKQCGPGAKPEIMRKLGASDWSVQGSGVCEITTFDSMRQWRDDRTEKSIRIIYYKGQSNQLTSHGYYEGGGVLRKYDVAQDKSTSNPVATIDIAKGTGSATWHPGVPS